jgi:hypothetical protein
MRHFGYSERRVRNIEPTKIAPKKAKFVPAKKAKFSVGKDGKIVDL